MQIRLLVSSVLTQRCEITKYGLSVQMFEVYRVDVLQ